MHFLLHPEYNDIKPLFVPDRPLIANPEFKKGEVSKAYTFIIQDFRYLISRMSKEDHRKFIIATYPREFSANEMICEFVCAMCTLVLSVVDNLYTIELQTGRSAKKAIGGYNYRSMIRAAYRSTMWENTLYNIEDCLSICENRIDHYRYFKNRLKEAVNSDIIILVENPITDG